MSAMYDCTAIGSLPFAALESCCARAGLPSTARAMSSSNERSNVKLNNHLCRNISLILHTFCNITEVANGTGLLLFAAISAPKALPHYAGVRGLAHLLTSFPGMVSPMDKPGATGQARTTPRGKSLVRRSQGRLFR